MLVFKVARKPYGWAVCMDEAMSTPFRSRDLAVQEANCLCEAIRSHGVLAEVVIEGADPPETAEARDRHSSSLLSARLRSRRPQRL